MRRTLVVICLLVLALVGRAEQTVRVYSPSEVPNVQLQDSTRLVSDPSNYIADALEREINFSLRDIRSRYGVEFAVVVVPSIGTRDIEGFSTELFRLWGLGEQRRNNGLLLLLAVEQNQGRFEVGYGLEGNVTDATTGRVWRQYMVPHLRSGDYGGAVSAGVQAIASVLERSDERGASGRSMGDEEGDLLKSFLWFVIVVALGVSVFSFTAVYTDSGTIRTPDQARKRLPALRRSISQYTWVIALCTLPLVLIFIPWSRRVLRRVERLGKTCPHCASEALEEDATEDVELHLTPYQLVEQRIGSRRYRGLRCGHCRHYVISGETIPATPYKQCIRCGSVAVRALSSRYVYDAQGRRVLRRQTQCLCCDDVQTRDDLDRTGEDLLALGLTLGTLASRGRSYGRSGGFGGGFGGGGFGGGSSGGGGFTGGW